MMFWFGLCSGSPQFMMFEAVPVRPMFRLALIHACSCLAYILSGCNSWCCSGSSCVSVRCNSWFPGLTYNSFCFSLWYCSGLTHVSVRFNTRCCPGWPMFQSALIFGVPVRSMFRLALINTTVPVWPLFRFASIHVVPPSFRFALILIFRFGVYRLAPVHDTVPVRPIFRSTSIHDVSIQSMFRFASILWHCSDLACIEARFTSWCPGLAYISVRFNSCWSAFISIRFNFQRSGSVYVGSLQFLIFRFGPCSGSFRFLIFRFSIYFGSPQFIMLFRFALINVYPPSVRFALVRVTVPVRLIIISSSA